MSEVSQMSDKDLLKEIQRRFEEKSASISEMEFMTKKLLDLNDKTKKADEIKSQFLSLIKNEFNNPLSSLLNLSKSLVDKRHPERFTEISLMMQMELLRLDFHMKNIFVATELEAGESQNDFSIIDFKSIFKDALAYCIYTIEDKKLNINLNICEDSNFVSDSQKIFMIILNLLSNACEFSYSKKDVIINLCEKENTFLIEVTDYGEGIHQPFKKEIFNRFAKYTTGKTRSHSGLGLGLSIVKVLVEQLDGNIDYESKDGLTIFNITLPKLSKDSAKSSSGGNDFLFDDFSDGDMFEL